MLIFHYTKSKFTSLKQKMTSPKNQDAPGHPRTSQGAIGTPRTPQSCPKDPPGTSQERLLRDLELLIPLDFCYTSQLIFTISHHRTLGNSRKSQLLLYVPAKTYTFDEWEIVAIV